MVDEKGSSQTRLRVVILAANEALGAISAFKRASDGTQRQFRFCLPAIGIMSGVVRRRRSHPGEVTSMSTAAAPTTPGRRSRRWWYVLAIGAVVVLIVVGTILTLRFHPFGIGGGGAASKPHPTERTTGAEKTATDKSAAGDKSPGAARITHEKATPTPGA
jgi:hypothetical protein